MPLQLANSTVLLTITAHRLQAKAFSGIISCNLHCKSTGQRALLSHFIGLENEAYKAWVTCHPCYRKWSQVHAHIFQPQPTGQACVPQLAKTTGAKCYLPCPTSHGILITELNFGFQMPKCCLQKCCSVGNLNFYIYIFMCLPRLGNICLRGGNLIQIKFHIKQN